MTSTTANLTSSFKETSKAQLRWNEGGVEWTDGHLLVIFSSCLIIGEDIAFWLLNGTIDFSVGFATGSLNIGEVFYAKIVAYLLLVPVFLGLKFLYYVVRYPDAVFGGSCPLKAKQVLSLDWFAVGILATSFPLALSHFGAVLASLVVGALGILILPILFDTERSQDMVRTGGFVGAALVNVWLVHFPPRDLPILTYKIPTEIVSQLLALTNSFTLGPILVAIFAVVLNLVMSSPPVYEVPFVRMTNPERQPIVVVVASAFIGTLFYLTVQGIWTGEFVIVPDVVDNLVKI